MAKCYDCGLECESPAWVDVVVPNDIWRLISPTHDEGGLLCFNCINARLRELDLCNIPFRIASGPLGFDVNAPLRGDPVKPVDWATWSGR